MTVGCRLVDAARNGRDWTPVSRLTAARREAIDAAAGQAVEMLAPVAVMFEVQPPQ